MVSYSNIEHAARQLAGIAHTTPALRSHTVDSQLDTQTYFKCENFQRMGAFKFRGAYHALSQLSPAQKKQGVITYSSGNHAQAIALSGKLLEMNRLIIMPKDAPEVKLAATRDYGAEIILYDKSQITREELATRLAKEKKLIVIPPYDHPDVIAGQGTAVKEFIEQTGPHDYLLVCCGGGGLLAGSALAANALAPSCKVIGVEPERADDATRSFYSGLLQSIYNPDTIADGARTPHLGKYTFPLIMQHVDSMLTVSEEAILCAMRFLWERMKLVVEPTGALATAALFTHADMFAGSKVGVVISGGNVDLSRLNTYFTQR